MKGLKTKGGINIVDSLANKLYSVLFDSINLDKNKKQIVVYSLNLAIRYGMMYLIVIAIALPLGTLMDTLAFMLTFMAIRYSFGGWHSKNEYVCFAISILVSILAGYIPKIIKVNVLIYAAIYILAFVIAIKVGVVDNPVKRLSAEKKIKFKRRGLVILTLLFCINMLMLIFEFRSISIAILTGVFIGFVNLLFGK